MGEHQEPKLDEKEDIDECITVKVRCPPCESCEDTTFDICIPRLDFNLTTFRAKIIASIYKLNDTFSITYIDDEEDEITVGSDEELGEAMRICAGSPIFVIKSVSKKKSCIVAQKECNK